MIVLSLCDLTTNMVRPWAEAGYACYCVDSAHPAGATEGAHPNITLVGADVRTYIPPRAEYAAAFAAPPCTDLAVSGARWLSEKGMPALIAAIEVFDACRRILEWTEAPAAMENPVSTMATYWRKPDYYFDPCDYAGYLDDPAADAYKKKTCLWTSKRFVMPEKRPVPAVLGSKMHKMGPSPDRQRLRSETPMGFAMAVFRSNSTWSTILSSARDADSRYLATLFSFGAAVSAIGQNDDQGAWVKPLTS